MTLNDLERHNGRYFTEFGGFGADYVKWLNIDLYCLRQKGSPKSLVLADISFMAIFVDVTEDECNIIIIYLKTKMCTGSVLNLGTIWQNVTEL